MIRDIIVHHRHLKENYFNIRNHSFFVQKDGMHMAKEITIKLDDNLFSKIKQHKKPENELVESAIKKFFSKSNKEEKLITTLKKELENTQREKKILENENKSLEIDNVCLQQQSRNLQGKIDDLMELYPSAMALLGKTPVTTQIKKNSWKIRE